MQTAYEAVTKALGLYVRAAMGDCVDFKIKSLGNIIKTSVVTGGRAWGEGPATNSGKPLYLLELCVFVSLKWKSQLPSGRMSMKITQDNKLQVPINVNAQRGVCKAALFVRVA